MDFLDPYNIAGRASTPPVRSSDTTESAAELEPSLNEEINEVIGQFGKFWGGFKKQSQAAFEAARKDIGEAVNQAQKEFSKFAPIIEPTTVPNSQISEDFNAGVGPPRDEDEEQQPSSSSPPEHVTSSIQTLFARIQSSLPPNISTTLQENLPSSLKDASGNVHIDFAQLTSTLSTEFQRVQGVTRAQAEEYVHKSEALLKEAGEFLKEAVKVVPPNPDDGDNTSNIVWDGIGSDMWVMPSPVGTHGWGANSASSMKGKGKMRDDVNSGAASHLAAGSRVEALLQRLKRDPEMIKLNPMEDDAIKFLYAEWVKNEVDVRDSGMDNDFWRERIKIVLEEKVSGAALSTTRDALVPSIMDEQTFWVRYFFRIFQIESEEERRKAILSGASQTADEDFSWEDEDEDDAITPISTGTAVPTIQNAVDSRQSNETLVDHKTAKLFSENKSDSLSTPATTSPRESSESSFDVVSSGHLSSVSEVTGPDSRAEKLEKDEDVDSDWE